MNIADIVVLLVLAFFLVLAARAVIRDRKNGATCGCACGDEVCRGRCGHVNTEHMSKQTKKEIKQAIKDLKAKQKANAKG